MVSPLVRGMPVRQKIERAPEAVEIGPEVDRSGIVRLLGGHVVDRTHGGPGCGEHRKLIGSVVGRVRINAGQAQIDQF